MKNLLFISTPAFMVECKSIVLGQKEVDEIRDAILRVNESAAKTAAAYRSFFIS